MGLISFLPGSTDYQVWESGLLDLKPAALRKGLQKAKDYTGWLALGDFRELCRITSDDLGVPTIRAAMLEAAQAVGDKLTYHWSHPIVYRAGCAVGWYDMQHKSEHELLPIFEHAYTVLFNRLLDGDTLDMPVQKALPPKVFIKATEEKAKTTIQRMRELVA